MKGGKKESFVLDQNTALQNVLAGLPRTSTPDQIHCRKKLRSSILSSFLKA